MKRVESDFLGKVPVPKDAYYGAFTVRAMEHFKLSPHKIPAPLLRCLLLVKKASALANLEEGLLEKRVADAIAKACDEALEGKFDDQFVLDAFQAGAGTPYNMNANEVLANRATELLGGKKGEYKIHPNNHVNMSQSSNDVIPTATRLACLFLWPELDPSTQRLENAFSSKANQFSKLVKPARTHLQDAVPMTLGQEFASYASAIRRSRKRMKEGFETLREIHLGGTATGTGINTTPTYRKTVCRILSNLSRITLSPTKDAIELTQNHNDFLHAAHALTLLGTDLIRISTNLKLLSSGPKTGLGEITLPEVEPGSSIMPGKINPSIVEAAEMAAMHGIGSMHAVELSCQNAQLDLNSNTPLIAFELLSTMDLYAKTCAMLADSCVNGITANAKTMDRYINESTIAATALNPVLGYSEVSKLVQEALKKGKTVQDVVLEKKRLTKKQLDELLAPERLTQPNLGVQKRA